MKNLDSLILAHNQLTTVPANVFRHLTLLSSLELEGNNIAYVDKDAFAGLEGIPNLYSHDYACFLTCVTLKDFINTREYTLEIHNVICAILTSPQFRNI